MKGLSSILRWTAVWTVVLYAVWIVLAAAFIAIKREPGNYDFVFWVQTTSVGVLCIALGIFAAIVFVGDPGNDKTGAVAYGFLGTFSIAVILAAFVRDIASLHVPWEAWVVLAIAAIGTLDFFYIYRSGQPIRPKTFAKLVVLLQTEDSPEVSIQPTAYFRNERYQVEADSEQEETIFFKRCAAVFRAKTRNGRDVEFVEKYGEARLEQSALVGTLAYQTIWMRGKELKRVAKVVFLDENDKPMTIDEFQKLAFDQSSQLLLED